MANVLFVHQNYPGQFPHITDALLARGDKLAAIGSKTARGRPGVDLRRWSTARGTTAGLFDIATRAEADMIRGRAAAEAALQLKRDGFTPDVIIGHPGWGETLFLGEVWPEARMILFGEIMYRSRGGDTGFDPEFSQPSFDRDVRTHAKNATQCLAYACADRIVCPTEYQASTFLPVLRPLIRVVHEGVDLNHAAPRPGATFTLPNDRVLDGGTPVITYVGRTLEPLRGFHILMRALPDFLDSCPEAQVIVIGDEVRVGYGGGPPKGHTWKSWLVAELGSRLDLSRVHFVGRVTHRHLIDAFSISWAHVYYTYPFVLSWSLVEAMATECLVIASDTTPLADAIENGKEGILLPFFDVAALSATLREAVRNPAKFQDLRRRARQRALAGFSRIDGTRVWLDLIDEQLSS